MNQSLIEIKAKLWTSHFIKIMFVGFTIGLCNQIQITTLPVYVQHLGGSKTIAGLMLGIFTLSALFFRPLVGNLLDRIGRRIVLVTGVAIFAIASFSYYFVDYIWLLLLLRFIHGAGFSAYSTSTGTIVADVVPNGRLMEGIGYYGVAGTMAVALGPALGLFLIVWAGISELYLLTFGIAALGLIAAYFINYEKEDASLPATPNFQDKVILDKDDLNRPRKNFFFERSALKPSLVMFFITLSQGAVISFLPLYAYSKGIGNIGIYFTVSAVALMISRPFTGRLSDRFGAAKIILPGMLLLILAFILIPFTTSVSGFVLIGILHGFGSGTAFPVLNAITIKMCPAERRGSGNATFLSSVDAGYGIGSIMWGIVSQNIGFAAIYFGAAASVAVSLIIFIVTLWKSNKSGARSFA